MEIYKDNNERLKAGLEKLLPENSNIIKLFGELNSIIY